MTVRMVGSRASLIGSMMLLGLSVSPAWAGQAASSDVDAYVCKFAGKCTPGSDATPSMEAPATKGFRLAAPSGAARGAAVPSTTAAPAAPAARTGTATARSRPVPVSRRAAAATRHAVPAGTRADLLLAFDYNSDQLTDEARERARTFAAALMTPELKDKRFLIEGHTDSRGARRVNIDLSRRRAESVASFLSAQGVDRSRLTVKGVGPDQPLPRTSPSAESNRRVEAVLLS